MISRVCIALLLFVRAADAGEIRGRVIYRGKLRPATVAVGKDQAVCGDTTPDPTMVLDAGGALANAVAWVEGQKPPVASPPGRATIDQRRCTYVPHVQAVTAGSTLTLVNSDAVFHTAHAYVGADTAFNVAMSFPGQTHDERLRRPGVVRFGCDAGHGWMSAFVHVFDHPWFALSDADGSFQIGDLPAGEHLVRVWHERLGERTARAKVTTDGASELTVIFE